MEAHGVNGQVAFDGMFVTITRKGLAARATVGKGEKRIPVRSVAAVQWKPAGFATNGYIQFTVSGGNENRARFGKQTVDAAKDENSVVFSKGHQGEFEALRSAIEAVIAGGPQPAPSQGSVAEELAKLAQLRDSGALDDVEFTAAKARLLGS